MLERFDSPAGEPEVGEVELDECCDLVGAPAAGFGAVDDVLEALLELEAGCGPGALTSWLADAGAEVTAFDVSTGLLDIARAALGERVRFLNADLAQPLPFANDAAFDLIVASLVMHYIEDWEPVFAELHRVLAPGGAVVFSTHHPAMDWREHSPENYFAIKQVTEHWRNAGEGRPMTFWRRPLTAMTAAISGAGFIIEELVEAAPAPELRESDACRFAVLSTRPMFLHFRLRSSPGWHQSTAQNAF